MIIAKLWHAFKAQLNKAGKHGMSGERGGEMKEGPAMVAAKKRGKKSATASETAKPPLQPKRPVSVPEPGDESPTTTADEDAPARE